MRGSKQPERERGGPWIGLAATVFYPFTMALAKTDIVGAEHVPRRGPVILVCNHVSYLDPVYDAVAVHRAGRVPRFLAKNTLWKPPINRVLDGAGQIPVYRGTADAKQSLAAAFQALDDGKMIVIYPEGTITRDPDGWPMQAMIGAGRLALERPDVPVLPFARWGTREIYDHYAKKFRPLPRKTVSTRFGPPVDLESFRARGGESVNARRVTEHVMKRVRELLGEVRGQRPPEKVFRYDRKAAQHKEAQRKRADDERD